MAFGQCQFRSRSDEPEVRVHSAPNFGSTRQQRVHERDGLLCAHRFGPARGRKATGFRGCPGRAIPGGSAIVEGRRAHPVEIKRIIAGPQPGLGKALPGGSRKAIGELDGGMRWDGRSWRASCARLGLVGEEFQLGPGSKRAGRTQAPAVGPFVFDRIAMGWESRSNCRISATLSCAATLLLTWSTPSVGDKASGACRLPDRGWLRAGTCESKAPMDLNARMLSRRTPGNTSLRPSTPWF
jgi:hypothetical protein